MHRCNSVIAPLARGSALLAACVLLCATALACIHSPLVYKGVVTERLKEAFLFHDGELSHLVVRTSLNAKDGLPDSMAWVIPLPSLPKIMEEAGSGIFRELFSLTVPPPPPPRPKPAAVPAPAPAAAAAPAAPAIKVHAVTVAGDYRLQPIEILSDAAGDELNAWLTQNGFGRVLPENQRHYLKKGAVFLAVKVGALKGADAELKPLHLAYRAERPALPLKFSTHSGEFDLTLYTLTPDKPAMDAFTAFHLEQVHSAEVRGADIEMTAPDLHKLIGNRAGWLTRFQAVHYNTKGKMVADLPADPTVGVVTPTPVNWMVIASELLDQLIPLMTPVLIMLAFGALAYWQRGRSGKPWRLRAAVYAALSGSVYTGRYIAPDILLIQLMVLAFLALAFGALAYEQRGRHGKPWRLRAFAYAVVSCFVYIGWFTFSIEYSGYQRRMSSDLYFAAPMVQAQVEEEAGKLKSPAGAGAKLNAPAGYSISRDGVISYELDPTVAGRRVKFVLTPVMKDGVITWDYASYPKAAAQR